MRLHDGRSFVARPTLHALACVEDERGPISEVFDRLMADPWFCDVASVVECCTDGAVSRTDVLVTGFASFCETAASLVATAFDERAEKHAKKGKRSERHDSTDGRLPVDRMAGTAIAIWHMSPDAAWRMTVTEWWDAASMQIEANQGGEHATEWERLTEEERDEIRRQTAAMPDVWPTGGGEAA